MEKEPIGQLIGYIRVSTKDQKTDRQLDLLTAAGVSKIYTEKQSGKTITNRKEFEKMMNELQPGDVVVVTDLTRISRNTVDLLNIVSDLKCKDAYLKSLDSPWLDLSQNTPFQELLITFMAGLSQFERRLISQRVSEGLYAAKLQGRVGGRPTIDNDKIQFAFELYQSGHSVREICAKAQISRSSFYNYKKEGFALATKKFKTAEERKAELTDLTDRLQQGVKDIFASERYAAYLNTMSKFHHYSTNNSLLIYLQMPDASCVAGYTTWQKLNRQVRKGETSIHIIAPTPYTTVKTVQVIDPITQKPKIDQTGKPITEEKETTIMPFKSVSVFDISQTDGEPLPEIASVIDDPIDHFDEIMDALKQVSPYPIDLQPIPGSTNGYCDYINERIVVDINNPPAQQIKTAIHEIAHATMHATAVQKKFSTDKLQDRSTVEVEAESIAFIVSAHYGLDTSDYSFGYVASWSKDKELKELQASLSTIQNHAQQIIDQLDGLLLDLQQKQEITQDILFTDGKKSLTAEIHNIKQEQKEQQAQKNTIQSVPEKTPIQKKTPRMER